MALSFANQFWDAVTGDDRQHSQWYDRNTLWLSGKYK
jgi:hypothetical protein